MVGILSRFLLGFSLFSGALAVSFRDCNGEKMSLERGENVKVPGSWSSSWVMVLNDFGIFSSLQKLVGVAGECCF